MSEAAIEKEIQEKGLNAPRLTPELIDAAIVSEFYVQGKEAIAQGHSISGLGMLFDEPTESALKCLTICVLVLRNGFTVVGKSACASPENFNSELGRKIAREDARKQIWFLEGYALKNRLMQKE